MAQTLKNLLSMQEAWVSSLGQEDPLEKGASSFISFGYIPRSGITESYSNSTLNFVKKKKEKKKKKKPYCFPSGHTILQEIDLKANLRS